MQTEKTHLTCCICGEGAGKWHQHWNRDTGYGICVACVASEAARLDPEELKSFYGVVMNNYDQPMVRHLGRRYRVLAATKDQDAANAFMERTPSAAVLLVFDDGTIIISDKTDEGEVIPHVGEVREVAA